MPHRWLCMLPRFFTAAAVVIGNIGWPALPNNGFVDLHCLSGSHPDLIRRPAWCEGWARFRLLDRQSHTGLRAGRLYRDHDWNRRPRLCVRRDSDVDLSDACYHAG